ncbi:MAG: hypothetical protein HY272_12385 [Gammaproteobacteria bacterium]|nr:hypothetical protein [Gammaproteobacteria bacterium]
MRTTNFRITTLAASLLFCLSANAEERGLDFAVIFSHQATPLLTNNQPIELRYDSAAIRIAEISSLPVRLDISGGPLGARLRPDTANRGELSGHFFSLTLSSSFPIVGPLVAGASMGYSYHTADSENSTAKFDLNWRQTEARLMLGMRLRDTLQLYGCGRRINIDGEELIQTATAQSTDLSEQYPNGACLGLQLETGDGGYVNIEWLNHNSDGLYLSFGRRYRD